jgi:hypothetical protein
VTIEVHGPVPDRTHPGRCADANSPHASALVEATRKALENGAQSFPLAAKLEASFVYRAAPAPEYSGYDAATVIEEILVAAGLFPDEREVEEERVTHEPSAPQGYSVTIQEIEPRGP